MGSIDPSAASIEGFIGYDRNLPVTKIAGSVARYRNGFDRILTTVHDIRFEKDQHTLNVHGFEYFSLTQVGAKSSNDHDFSDATYIKSTLYPETQSLIQSATSASRVYCYSHLVRRKPLSDVQAIIDNKDIPDTQLTRLSVPSPAVHIDHSAKGSWEVLADNLGEAEATAIKSSGKRWAIINLWRPCKTIKRDPLCMVDARTVEEKDLVPQRIHLPKDTSSTFKDVSRGASFESVGVKPNPQHKWYYCSDMTPDEALLLKIHDSAAQHVRYSGNEADWVAGGVPHTSLQIPGTEILEPRESIELRCLVFWD